MTAVGIGNTSNSNNNNNMSISADSSIGITSTSTTTSDTAPTSTAAAGIRTYNSETNALLTPLATLELQYFKAVSQYRRRNYEKCIEVCNAMLQAGHENNVQMFVTSPDDDDDDNNRDDREEAGRANNDASISRYSSNLQRTALRQGGQRYQGSYVGSNNNNNYNNKASSRMPTWMMEGVWQLKMRALTQRIYVDDLETNDDGDEVNEELEFERIATAARPGTSIKTAFIPRPSTSKRQRTATSTGSRSSQTNVTSSSSNGMRTGDSSSRISTRPTSGMSRPSTALSRPGSSLGTRPASRCATASRVRATSAAAYNVGDATAPLYQASRLNPTIYAERQVLVKALFQFLYYHEADIQKAYSLCEAVFEVHNKQKRTTKTAAATATAITGQRHHHQHHQQQQQQLPMAQPLSHHHQTNANSSDWWWYQQMGRCLLALHYPRRAETFLLQSLSAFPAHPDTYLLLSRLYQRLQQPDRALQLIASAIERHPFDVQYRIEQGRIYDGMLKSDDAMQIYRLISKLNPINIEALACIALNYFYDNNPEMALMYYRRILSLGIHSPELYCNIALCCLYGGQVDLVLPCFQRALLTAKTADQKADIWYNLSFVAITTGDFHLARRCFQLCLTNDARNGAALNNLAVLSAHSGDILKAKSYLNAAKEVLQNSAEVEANLKYMEAHYKL